MIQTGSDDDSSAVLEAQIDHVMVLTLNRRTRARDPGVGALVQREPSAFLDRKRTPIEVEQDYYTQITFKQQPPLGELALH